jgi:hypothetical protein
MRKKKTLRKTLRKGGRSTNKRANNKRMKKHRSKRMSRKNRAINRANKFKKGGGYYSDLAACPAGGLPVIKSYDNLAPPYFVKSDKPMSCSPSGVVGGG